jgi:hypothetical protein
MLIPSGCPQWSLSAHAGSASEKTATVGMPRTRQVRMTRTAISPRFATRTLRKSGTRLLQHKPAGPSPSRPRHRRARTVTSSYCGVWNSSPAALRASTTPSVYSTSASPWGDRPGRTRGRVGEVPSLSAMSPTTVDRGFNALSVNDRDARACHGASWLDDPAILGGSSRPRQPCPRGTGAAGGAASSSSGPLAGRGRGSRTTRRSSASGAGGSARGSAGRFPPTRRRTPCGAAART